MFPQKTYLQTLSFSSVGVVSGESKIVYTIFKVPMIVPVLLKVTLIGALWLM